MFRWFKQETISRADLQSEIEQNLEEAGKQLLNAMRYAKQHGYIAIIQDAIELNKIKESDFQIRIMTENNLKIK